MQRVTLDGRLWRARLMQQRCTCATACATGRSFACLHEQNGGPAGVEGTVGVMVEQSDVKTAIFIRARSDGGHAP
jgi:hypothetical protein